MKKYTIYILLAVGIFLAGVFTGSKAVPPKTITVEKEVVKTQIDTKTVIKRVKTPDGTVTTEISKEDKSKIESDKSKKVEISNVKQWRASIYTTLKTDQYGIMLERRLIGPVFVGGWITTEKVGGISVGLEF